MRWNLTCESFSPSLEASFFLSGLLMYFCFWNIFSKALRCTSENTALLSIPLRGFPLATRGHENVPGIGTTEEDTATQGDRKQSGLNLYQTTFSGRSHDLQREQVEKRVSTFRPCSAPACEWNGTRWLISTLAGLQQHWYGKEAAYPLRNAVRADRRVNKPWTVIV